MIKSKKNTQKLYIELKASRKKVDKYFKRLNQYYPVPKTIKVLKAILEGVDKINSSTKESNVKLESVVNQYIEYDQDLKAISDRIDHSKVFIERSNSGENIKDILAEIK